MNEFDFEARTRIVFGRHKIDTVGKCALELGASRALVVSDPGIVQAGHSQRGCDSLKQSGIESLVFEGVHENPTTDDVNTGCEVAQAFHPDLILSLIHI